MGCRQWWVPVTPPRRSRMASGFASTVGGASSRCCSHEHCRRMTVTLTAADVAEIMRIVEQSTFDELSLEIEGIKLTLRRAGATGKILQSVTTLNTDAAATGASRSATAIAPAAARVAASRPVEAALK